MAKCHPDVWKLASYLDDPPTNRGKNTSRSNDQTLPSKTSTSMKWRGGGQNNYLEDLLVGCLGKVKQISPEFW